MSKVFRWRVLLVVAVMGGAVALILARPVRLGLDLQGGTQIVLEAQDTPRQRSTTTPRHALSRYSAGAWTP